MANKARIYDDGGKSIDRYTLVVPSVNEPGKLDMYGFDENPYYPQGFGQFAGSCDKMPSYAHLGKLISYNDLPDQAQRYVKEVLTLPLPDGYGMSLSVLSSGRKARRKKPKKAGTRSATGIRGLTR